MRIPFEKIGRAAKLGMTAKREGDEGVRIQVVVGAVASSAIIDAVRGALVPQTTSGLVRVARLGATPIDVKPDTDVVLVISEGEEDLEEGVRQMVVAGAPVAVLASDRTAVPFIQSDTPLLGLVADEDTDRLLRRLARWILSRSEKHAALAANFPFLRNAASERIVGGCALTNMATGALFFTPGADYPVITLAQLGMMMQLATIYGKPLALERGYEAAAVAGSGLVLRAASRVAVKRLPSWAGFAAQALVAGAGTVAMGLALREVYERDVDYAPVNRLACRAVRGVKDLYDAMAANPAPVAQDMDV